jgi:hypothetical protein
MNERIVSHIEQSLSGRCIIAEASMLKMIVSNLSPYLLFIIDFFFQLFDLLSKIAEQLFLPA